MNKTQSNSLRSKLKNILIFGLDAYAFSLSLLAILWLFTGERFFFVNIYVSTNPGIFFALPLVAILALFLRSPRTLAFIIIPSLTFTIWYLPRFLPRTIETTSGQAINLLSYNLYAGNHDFAVLDGILEETDADIVALQEVNRDMANWLEANWTEAYPYQVRYSVEGDGPQYSGRMLMSIYPILEYEIVDSPINTKLYIRAALDFFGEELIVYNVHMPPPQVINIFSTAARSQALNTLLNAAETDRPVIIMGDFNMTDQSSDYHMISGIYQDSFALSSSGLGTTWPNARNLHENLFFMPSMIRIDYIFLSAEVSPIRSEVLYEGVADHYPLHVEAILK